jgi:sporulation protein YlmC with PRC-barrel domain
MILSDLLDRPVFAADGEYLGLVVDARFALDGTPHQLLNSPRLVGFIVSPISRTSFMGYERTGVRAPALIAAWFRRRERGSFLVLWEDVGSLEGTTVALRSRAKLYAPQLAGDGGAGA